MTATRRVRNRLKGIACDAVNAILSTATMNFHKLFGAFLLYLMQAWGGISDLREPFFKRGMQTPESDIIRFH